MPPRIEVEQLAPEEFWVRVIDGESEKTHRVTMRADAYEGALDDQAEPSELVVRAVELLLSRERPKPIPDRCDLTIIGRYLTEFERVKNRRTTQ